MQKERFVGWIVLRILDAKKKLTISEGHNPSRFEKISEMLERERERERTTSI